MEKIKGIDVSYCQANLDYSKVVAAGVKFVIIRAGFSRTKDNLLEYHVKNCEKYNIPYGFYYYNYAKNVKDTIEAAKCCLNFIKNYHPTYPVFFDMEEAEQLNNIDKNTLTKMALSFCETIEKGGFPAGIYTNPSWLEHGYNKSELSKYDIWLAHWTSSPSQYGQTIWQWGVDNIAGMDVDGDICYIDYPSKVNKWYKEHGKTTPTNNIDNKQDNTKPSSNNTITTCKFKKGDKVKVKSKSVKFSNGVTPASFVFTTTFTVLNISTNGKECLVGLVKNGKNENTGWFYANDLVLASSASNNANKNNTTNNNSTTNNNTSSFKVGTKVKVKNGSKTYDNKSVASFVYKNVYTIDELVKDRAVLDKKGINTAFNTKNLMIQKSTKPNTTKPSTTNKTIKVGSTVKIKNGAKSYNGTSVASFVYSKQYKVDELVKDRAVLDSKGINTAFNTKDLIFVK